MKVKKTKNGNVKMVMTISQYEALEHMLVHISTEDFEEGTYDYDKASIVESIYNELPPSWRTH